MPSLVRLILAKCDSSDIYPHRGIRDWDNRASRGWTEDCADGETRGYGVHYLPALGVFVFYLSHCTS
jgi:hypothetical protein